MEPIHPVDAVISGGPPYCCLLDILQHVEAVPPTGDSPMSDLCWICQQNSVAIMRAANRPDEDKTEVKINNTLVQSIKPLAFSELQISYSFQASCTAYNKSTHCPVNLYGGL